MSSKRFKKYHDNTSILCHHRADTLCCHLAWEFCGAFRASVSDDENRFGGTLMGLTERRYYEGFSYALFKEQNMDTIFIEPSHTFNPAGAWEVKGKLLRGEVLAIIAALRSRLVPDMFKEHLVIPINGLFFYEYLRQGDTGVP
ncbi:hypothetical protein AWENTII_010868 [Aspergillus wentii]